MSQFSVVPDAVAGFANRLVAIVRVRIQSNVKVTIRDQTNAQLQITSAVVPTPDEALKRTVTVKKEFGVVPPVSE